MSEPILVTERRGHVVVLRLNRPDVRNALSADLIGQLGLALLDAERDAEIRCAVLTGTGEKAFCAGLDLKDFAASGTPNPDPEGGAAFQRLLRGDVEVPFVGAANGAAVAGGFELLLGCDVVVAAEEATFGLPEVKRGLFAPFGSVVAGSRIPRAVALELTLTGDPIDASRALALGLVNQVVPRDGVLDAAIELAERIAGNAPLAVQATRDVVRLASTDAPAAWERQGEWVPKVFGSNDAREGASAFVERRAPVWTGT